MLKLHFDAQFNLHYGAIMDFPTDPLLKPTDSSFSDPTPADQNAGELADREVAQVFNIIDLPKLVLIKVLEHVAYLEGYPFSLIKTCRAFNALMTKGGSLFLRIVKRLNQQKLTWVDDKDKQVSPMIDAAIAAFKDHRILDGGALIQGIVEFGSTKVLTHALESSHILINKKDFLGRTILHLIVQPPGTSKDLYSKNFPSVPEEERVKMLKALLAAGAGINAQNSRGQTALHVAVETGSITMLEALLYATKPKIDTSIQDNEGHTALSLAKKNHFIEAVILLGGYAYKEKLMKTALSLLQEGQLHNAADVIQKIGYGKIEEAFKLKLDEAGINLISQTVEAFQEHRFYQAIELTRCIVYLNSLEALQTTLYSAGLSINEVGNWENPSGNNILSTATALHVAAAEGHSEGINALIFAGAEVNFQNNEGYTALHVAAAHGYENVINALWLEETDINIRHNGGCTPLHMAAANGHTEAINKLLELGAYIHAVDSEGRSAFNLATENDHDEAAEILLEATINPPPLIAEEFDDLGLGY